MIWRGTPPCPPAKHRRRHPCRIAAFPSSASGRRAALSGHCWPTPGHGSGSCSAPARRGSCSARWTTACWLISALAGATPWSRRRGQCGRCEGPLLRLVEEELIGVLVVREQLGVAAPGDRRL